LGSYKLYVLVAYHIERYLEQGGSDRPGEVLLSLLFRYGNVRRSYRGDSVGDTFRTYLSTGSVIECAGGSADLSNVFLIVHCLKLFDMSWCRLQAKLRSAEGKRSLSLLDSLIDSARLRHDRENRMELSQLALAQYPTYTYVKPITQDSPAHEPVSSRKPQSHSGRTDLPRLSAQFPIDLTAEQLVAGYRLTPDFLNRHPNSSPQSRSYRNATIG
jgi:hypothetical protein